MTAIERLRAVYRQQTPPPRVMQASADVFEDFRNSLTVITREGEADQGVPWLAFKASRVYRSSTLRPETVEIVG